MPHTSNGSCKRERCGGPAPLALAVGRAALLPAATSSRRPCVLQQATMEQQQHEGDEAPPPPLLAALQRLDDAAWRSVLLALLALHSSTSSLALTCRALRALCQRTQQCLRFRGQGTQDGALALVPERFLACTDVHLDVHTDDDALDALPALLPALARLPALTQLTLELNKPITESTSSMALMLHLVCAQLPRLHALTLESKTSSWSSNVRIWRALGSMTQLHSLQLVVLGSADDSLQHMTALSGFSGLQSLYVQRSSSTTCPQHHGYLASLGALTRLAVPLVSADGLAAISACTNLRHLQLWGPSSRAAPQPQLDDAICTALQRLAQLTRLALSNVDGTDSPAFASALGSMRQLEELEVSATSRATLAALAGLTKLTQLESNWAPGGATAAGTPPASAVVCASVREVDLHGAGIPWSAFPGATSIKQYESWAPAEFIAISTHCRQLTALKGEGGGVRMLVSVPAAERAAGIRSLSMLTALTSLAWRAGDNAELAALAMLGNLRALDVTCVSECTLAGAQVLATARQLSTVTLDVSKTRLMPAARDVVALLASLRHVQRLAIIWPG